MIYKLLHFFCRIYWKIIRPNTMGVKVIATYEQKIVLVRPTYSSLWHLPGGGVKKGETVIDAARREFLEECGVKIDSLKTEGIYSNFAEGKNDHIAVFSTNLESTELKPSMEIKECELFDLHELPATSPGNRRRIEEFNQNKLNGGLW